MKHASSLLLFVAVALFSIAFSDAIAQEVPGVVYSQGTVTGKMIDAGFLYGDSNYNAIIQASDGNVYYVICSHNKKSGANLFRYNPRNEKTDMIADITLTVGEDRTKTVNQGKVHTDFYEVDGKLYFTTHAGAWDMTYPGGHFMCYDLKTGKFQDFGIGIEHQGLVTMTMDTRRMRMYAMSWPGYNFCRYDVATGEKKHWPAAWAPYVMQGPRSIAVDPRTGNAYWHNINDTIVCYDYEKDEVEILTKPKFDAPIIQIPLESFVAHVWRSIKWSEPLQRFFGVMYYSDYLFSWDPETSELEYYDRIASSPNRKSGRISYSTLAFEFSRDGKTLYYVASSDTAATGVEELHLVTYEIPLRRYTDHGVIRLDDGRIPRYCQGLEVGTDGNLYIVAWIPFTDQKSDKWKKMIDILYEGKPTLEVEKSGVIQEVNLIRIKDPLAK